MKNMMMKDKMMYLRSNVTNNLTSPKQGRLGMGLCLRALTILCLLMASVGAWAADYVFMNGDYFLGQTTAATTDFVPNASIYTGTSGSTFRNANNYYIRYNGGLQFSTTNSTNLTITNDQLTYSPNWYTVYYLNLNGTTWRMTNNNNRATAYTVAKRSITAGTTYSDFSITGEDYISSVGGFNYTHTNATVDAACTEYTFNDRTYYSTNDAQAASTTQPTTEVTTGYVWSLSANSYATVNATTGRITVNSMPTSDVDLTLTCTLNGTKSASKIVTLTKNPPVAAGYVIFNGSNYLNSSTAGTTQFDPNTCIWNGTSGGVFNNDAGYNLYRSNNNNNGTFQLSTTNSRNCTLRGTESGTTGQTIQVGTNTNAYLRYNGGWQTNATAGNVVFSVLRKTSAGVNTTTAPTISAAINSTNDGVQLSHTNVTGTYGLAYEDYIFYNNTHHYWYDGSSHDQKPATVDFASTNATYIWSIVSGDQYATIDASGNLKSKGVATTEQTVRVKLTTTHAASGYSNEQTYDVKLQDYAATNVTASIGDSHVIHTVGGTLTMRGSLSGNYSPAYTKFTVGYTSHNLYNGTDYGYNVPAINGGTGCVYTWSLSGEGKDYSSLSSLTGQQPILTYDTDAGHDIVVTLNLRVTHPDFPTFNVTADPYDVTLYSASITAPVITYDEGTSSVTLTVPSEGTTYYTTDGSDPKTSGTKQEYTAPFTITTSPTTVKTYSERWGTQSDVAEETFTLKLATPTIAVSDNGVATITLDGAPAGTEFRYTTDGSDPTESSPQYDAENKPTLSNGATIKVIAVKGGYTSSDVAEETFSISSGVRDGKVILNDYEDHTWTYYAGVNPEVDGGNYNTNYKGKLYSPNPRNVKITYKANGGAVSIDESETEFVYYKTLEESATAGEYQYQVISNPFSKRPTGKGFGGWQITKGANYIKNKTANATLGLDEEIVFNNLGNPGVNVTAAEIEFTATWVDATIKYGTDNISSTDFRNGTYETNILVLNAASDATLAPSYPVTIMSVEPDGSRSYRNNAFTGNITPSSTGVTKIEFTQWNSTNTVTCNYHNLWIGRGITSTSRCANMIVGGNTTTTASPQFHVKVESGIYRYMSFLSGYYNNGGTATGTGFDITGGNTNANFTLGNDYDRAKGTNTNLQFQYGLTLGRSGSFQSANRSNTKAFNLTVKSGRLGYTFFMEGTTTADHLQGGAGYGFYLSSGGSQTYMGTRNVLIEGGDLSTVGSGIDSRNNTTGTNTDPSTTTNYGNLGFNFRMKGGTIHGNVYGGAAKSPAGGNRVMVVTGGQIKGWFAAGCNGTDSDGGQTYGTSWVYIGGNGKVDSEGSTKQLGYASGGNVYAAGAGRTGAATCGEMTFGTNLVIADNSYIERGAYGGGNYGYALASTNIYITGGTNKGDTDTNSGNAKGGVYGGANQQDGPGINIWMTGGKMYGGVYGGCNTKGTITGDVTMQINGGQVGQDAEHTENIHGGGYGQLTVVNGSVDITLGKTGTARDADGVTVWGDVYGGSALGQVNATATVGTTALSNIRYNNNTATNVTMNAGYIHGSLYGGALGNAGTAANVYGPVQVQVYGGSVFNTDGTGANGSGAVYGANNINGAPQRSVTVDIYGTNSAPAEGEYALFSVYGGGNAADYTYGNGYPKVTVHNCDNSIEYVYGGGNAAAVAATDVTIYGGNKIGNVFGGGNGQVRAADVTGGTSVKIYGGTIGDVYGGSNTNGSIAGAISVNVNAQAEDGHDKCDVNIDNVYGGGNKAASAVGNVTIGCAEHIGAVYGGANQANITGNINLSIVSGHIDNVFGGNNTSGNIDGTITVTVNDNNSACGMEVGNVYGGGNQAAYGSGTNYPVVNIQNGHLTGSVFGGGLGETAVVTGNPQVTIGDTDDGHTVHIDGNVFGGGDAADVVGKPKVTVNNCNTMIGTKDGEGNWNAVGGTVYGGGNAAHVTGAGNGTSVTINGGDINRVFGGGNGEVSPANVEGNAVTTIHAGNIHQAFAGSNMQGNINGSATITVDHSNEGCEELIDEVYGGGNQAAGNAGTVTIECGAIVGDVYGGANQADINSPITLNITGGTINRVFGGNNTSGNISGAITVNVNKKDACALDLNYVYGAGNQASYTPSTPGAYPAVNILKGTVKQDVFGGGLGATAVVTSNPTVTVNGGTVSGNVFGGGSEANTVGTTSVTVQAGTVSTDVYGGGALADVEGNTTVAVTGGTVTGNAYGGGLGRLEDAGAGITAVAAAVTGNTTVNVSGGTTNNVFGCNNFNGGPQGTVNVTISGGTVTNDVYGGGNLAAASANPIVTISGGTMQDVYGGGLGEPAVITGNTTININKTAATMSVRNVFGGGSAADVAGNTAITMTEGTVSNIYGGGEAADVVVGAESTGKTVVNMNGGTVSHSIYGGGLGNTTNVATSTTVTANGGTVSEDVYGGSGFGKVGATTVTINNGATVTRDVFGGGFGQNADAGAGKEAYEADVTGNASVTINKGAVINGNVYGGNNTNGSPKGTITVLVDGPADATEKAATPLNLKDVFGGGKNAATTSTGAPQVTIQGCETVIARVFGGGDAAPAPATNVEIWGGHITSAFAGGNGEVKAADIVGDVTITIKGGAITNVFGGSNTAGNIGGAVNVVVDKDPAACDLDVTNLFGGGNLAPGKGGTLTIACTGDGKIDNVYGGANQADVEGDVTLVINGGNIGNAFGGNNQSGTINGAVKVVIDWDGDCGVNNLDNVYGGGNLAPYTTPDGMVGPTVQLINATINNNVYGGGLGKAAKIIGDPIVTLEGATVTGNIFGGGDAAPVEGSPTITATEGSAAKIFAGGKGATAVVTGNPTAVLNKTDEQTLTVTEIYGGGDAAEVTGNTTVTLTKGAVTNAFGGGNAAAINGNTLVTIANATASNVYGGGNLAGVTETATINMTGGNVTTGLYGGCNSEGTVTGDIAVNVTGGQVGTDAEHKANVHGGGYGSATQTAGNVAVAVNGAGVVVFGDIYGGSALGNVNDNTDDNTTVTIAAGTINGDVYGGGLGDASNAALVNGNVAVNINGGTVTGNVFGCNNVNGTPKGSVAVTVAADANATLAEVYGGGNMATYSPTTAQAPVVTILGCGNTIGYVYGGGNAADVPATNVTVWGGTIGNVFGGGHGNKDANPATEANVTGNVTVNIKGGTITNVFAGSNSKGNIGGTVALTIDKDGTCPMHITDVYGGGNQAAGNAGQVTIGCTGGADEGIQNVYGGANAADIGSEGSHSNIALTITGGSINNVFGGNNSSGKIYGTIDVTVDWNGSCTTNHINNVYGAGNQAAYIGSPTVKIYNGTVSQNVFGGGLGATAVVTGNPVVTIGDATAPAKVATVSGDVYGGGDAAAVVGTTQVNVIAKENTTINNVYGGGNAADVNGTDVNIDGGHITGMVFGGGHGNAGSGIAADVNGNVSVDVTGGTINKVFGGSNDKGNISGTVAVNINKGNDSNEMHITEVYGGGNVAAGNAGTVTIGCTGGDTEGIGTVYGGANNANVGNAIVLNISGGSIDNVFGGNNNGGAVAGSITVNVNWTGACGTNKLGNVYGAGNIASYTGNPTVNITNCTTTGSVFGGGKGKPAVVVGNPTVNIGSWTAGEVHIGGNVFGGGDLAAVEGAPTVTIRDCNTYIGGDLYGGGNAAPVFETNTTVWGGTIAGNLFGGGNGVNLDPVTGNPKGAQVGYAHDDTATGGTGNANTYLYGGTIGTWSGSTCTSGGGVFGGSNSNGNIRGNVNLNVDERACGETGATQCPLKIKEIYGAGNEAAYLGEGITFNLGCVSFLGEIYGGAKAADLNADAILTITSGTFGKVFGGNNVSGKLNGKIVVTIDETGCNPVIIDELYGGGNLAAYSVYGYEDELVDGKVVVKTSGVSPKADPVVNIISCTRIGTVFGGGYGESAVMVGSPTVNINQIKGIHAGTTPAGGDPIPDALGAIGTVFGGGNAAKVVGNTNVNVGTLAQNAHLSGPDTTPTAAGAYITGNVYGGGNRADVTGKTNVTIGK